MVFGIIGPLLSVAIPITKFILPEIDSFATNMLHRE